VDVLMIPVGGYFTIDAAQAKELAGQIGARVTVPMHYRSGTFGHPEIGPVEDFLSLCRDVAVLESGEMEITADTPRQTAVFPYLG